MKTVIVNAHVISPGVDMPCAAVEIVDGNGQTNRFYLQLRGGEGAGA